MCLSPLPFWVTPCSARGTLWDAKDGAQVQRKPGSALITVLSAPDPFLLGSAQCCSPRKPPLTTLEPGNHKHLSTEPWPASSPHCRDTAVGCASLLAFLLSNPGPPDLSSQECRCPLAPSQAWCKAGNTEHWKMSHCDQVTAALSPSGNSGGRWGGGQACLGASEQRRPWSFHGGSH